MYGFSKQLFDLWVKNQGVQNKLVGLKYFNVFGPNESHKGRMASAVFHLYPIAKSLSTVKLFKSDDSKFGDGEQKRDFIYVKDAARMTCEFLNHNQGGLYNIGSGVASTWNELASAIFKALSLPNKIDIAACMPLDAAVEDYINNYLIPQKTW